ncbi:hypothetical protein [Acinetobacter boissieri]|uniref:Phage baseplate assembly protein V n=1 Tax=Acinetobacter boissieri TaxID=1219383 RepID=A0A1G6H0R4_9GAMM|nr:hypothetical protein [Acinetobacter boissieri]SDB86976.1 hypothetical protein SAMN05421733_10325 [Acinetobacter boissieri]
MFQRAKILSYNPIDRTAQVHIFGLTDGVESGLTATFAYPVGDDDRDTERQIIEGNDVYIFFDGGDQARPVIAFYSSHGQGNVQDVRRIRQKNIELLADRNININAQIINIEANVNFTGKTTFNGDIEQTKGKIITPDIVIDGKSTKKHVHIDSRGSKTSVME